MLIGMDIDGVMTLYEEWAKENGTAYFAKPIVNANGYGIDELFGVSRTEAEQFWKANNEDYLLNCAARDGLYDFGKSLYQLGHKIVVITNRLSNLYGMEEQSARKYTEDFLNKNLYRYEGIYYSQNDKEQIATNLHLDWMIEDSVKFIQCISAVCPVIYPLTSYTKNFYEKNILCLSIQRTKQQTQGIETFNNTFAMRNFASAINIIESVT